MHGLVLRLNHEKNALGTYVLLPTVRSAPARAEGSSLGGVPYPTAGRCPLTHSWEVSPMPQLGGSHQKPQAGPSQQHPNSKALRRGFCPTQKRRSSDPPALLPGTFCSPSRANLRSTSQDQSQLPPS